VAAANIAAARTALAAAASAVNSDITSLVALKAPNAVQLLPYGTSAGNTGEVRFLELAANSSNYIAFKAADAIAANLTFVWPNTDGTAGQFLKTDGAGKLGWGSAGLAWTVVSGPSQQTTSNNGYITTSDSAQVVLALPAAPAIGDVVRVAGHGRGGWKIMQNAGQSILTQPIGGAPGGNWTAVDSVRAWWAIAASSDGAKLVATVWPGQLYTSTNSGLTWTAREGVGNWNSVASSSDGTKLVATNNGGQIYTSGDSGVSWTGHDSARNWTGVASSADGAKLVATVSSGQVYTSTDSGANWSARDSVRNWYCVASSADGSRLVAGLYSGLIYTSSDSGITWVPRATSRWWKSVTSSSDGVRLAALDNGGQIYTSADSGATWIARGNTQPWQSIASSADGTRLLAVGAGVIATSTDSGVTWNTLTGAVGTVQGAAVSGDGTMMATVINGGQAYLSTPATTPGSGGGLSGKRGASIELVYTATDTFLPISFAGSITAL